VVYVVDDEDGVRRVRVVCSDQFLVAHPRVSHRGQPVCNDAPPMARREGGSRPICRVCQKPIAENEPHYRAGRAWLHIKCYEKARLTTTRRRLR